MSNTNSLEELKQRLENKGINFEENPTLSLNFIKDKMVEVGGAYGAVTISLAELDLVIKEFSPMIIDKNLIIESDGSPIDMEKISKTICSLLSGSKKRSIAITFRGVFNAIGNKDWLYLNRLPDNIKVVRISSDTRALFKGVKLSFLKYVVKSKVFSIKNIEFEKSTVHVGSVATEGKEDEMETQTLNIEQCIFRNCVTCFQASYTRSLINFSNNIIISDEKPGYKPTIIGMSTGCSCIFSKNIIDVRTPIVDKVTISRYLNNPHGPLRGTLIIDNNVYKTEDENRVVEFICEKTNNSNLIISNMKAINKTRFTIPRVVADDEFGNTDGNIIISSNHNIDFNIVDVKSNLIFSKNKSCTIMNSGREGLGSSFNNSNVIVTNNLIDNTRISGVTGSKHINKNNIKWE